MKIVADQEAVQQILTVCDMALRGAGLRAFEIVTKVKQGILVGSLEAAAEQTEGKEAKKDSVT
jgi:hypothetical protein